MDSLSAPGLWLVLLLEFGVYLQPMHFLNQRFLFYFFPQCMSITLQIFTPLMISGARHDYGVLWRVLQRNLPHIWGLKRGALSYRGISLITPQATEVTGGLEWVGSSHPRCAGHLPPDAASTVLTKIS
jgi:hypothetical protein